jgi:hypothetical protein
MAEGQPAGGQIRQQRGDVPVADQPDQSGVRTRLGADGLVQGQQGRGHLSCAVVEDLRDPFGEMATRAYHTVVAVGPPAVLLPLVPTAGAGEFGHDSISMPDSLKDEVTRDG